MTRPRGRPSRDAPSVSPGDILVAALGVLDAKGVEAFTMRAVSDRLRISPMSIYHHFGDRDGLIEAMSDRVYAGVIAPDEGDALDRIGAFLRAYHAEVRRHPGLILLIFSCPAVFPRQARRMTDEITRLLIEAVCRHRPRRCGSRFSSTSPTGPRSPRPWRHGLNRSVARTTAMLRRSRCCCSN